jgi:hypothetical protein
MADETLQKLLSVSSRVELKQLLRDLGLSRKEATAKVRQIFDSSDEDDASEDDGAKDGPQVRMAKAFRADREKENLRVEHVAHFAKQAAEGHAIQVDRWNWGNSWTPGRDKSEDWHPTMKVADPEAVAQYSAQYVEAFEAAIKGCDNPDALESALLRFDWNGWRLQEDAVKRYMKEYGPQTKGVGGGA